jgi:prolipoprotein diacylglyceryltransferase
MGVHEMTFGEPTTLFTGMDLGDGILRHPVTLYEIIYLLLLWPTLKWLSNNLNLINGARFKLLILAYFTFRFLIEFIKPTYKYALGLDAIQYLAIGMFIYYYRYLIEPKLLIKNN